jgi:dihydrofolate reductase
MEFWPPIVKNSTGNKFMDDFAVAMDNVPKIVFSHTLKSMEWKTARLARRELEEEVLDLKQSHSHRNKDILVGSPSLIAALTNLNLIDEYQLCVHPVIAGSGLPLFKTINDKAILKLVKTKTFGSGTIALYYEPHKMIYE